LKSQLLRKPTTDQQLKFLNRLIVASLMAVSTKRSKLHQRPRV